MDRLFESLEPRMLLSADTLVDAFEDLRVDGDVVQDSAAMGAIIADADADAVYSRTSWDGENYWFQDSDGEVWSIWHGGAAHQTESGEHRWFLTNITDVTGELAGFRIQSMSGTFTPWRAFNILGLDADGDVVTYWWSPASGANHAGVRGTGWVLTNLSDSSDWSINEGDQPIFTGRTEVSMRGSSIVVAAIDSDTGIKHEIVHTPGQLGNAGEAWVSSFDRQSLADYLDREFVETGIAADFLDTLEQADVEVRVTSSGDVVVQQIGPFDIVLVELTVMSGLDVSAFNGDLPVFGNGEGNADDIVDLMLVLMNSGESFDVDTFFDGFDGIDL